MRGLPRLREVVRKLRGWLLVLDRVVLIARLEVGASRYPRTLRAWSYRSLPARWTAAILGRRETRWMGFPMVYEVRFESVLMHLHQKVVLGLLSQVNVPPGARVLDVGANVGQFGVALLSVRPDLEIVSLEPNPLSRALLERNASRHSAPWSVVPAGLSSEPGSAELWYVPGRSGQASIVRESAHRGMVSAPADRVASVRVDLISAEMLLERLPDREREFTLVKVDVEGYERMVIAELANLSWRYLLIEIGGARGGLTADEALALLRGQALEVTMVGEHDVNGDAVADVLFARHA